jgi:signal transduction histidine kinase
MGQLAAGIAHEINNPLTNASLSVQMIRSKLENSGIDADMSKKLASIENNVDRAATIAKELLQFSRQSETDFILLNIHEVIKRTLTLLRYRFKGIAIRQDLQDVPEITGDPIKLEQVFINVLTNAVEAMNGVGDINISTAYDKGYIKIEISDTGGGISAEHLTKIFDPFFTTKEVGKGTGLGLSICYGIMNQHNGIIELLSSEGKGTTVIIKLPAAKKIRGNHEKNTDSR